MLGARWAKAVSTGGVAGFATAPCGPEPGTGLVTGLSGIVVEGLPDGGCHVVEFCCELERTKTRDSAN